MSGNSPHVLQDQVLYWVGTTATAAAAVNIVTEPPAAMWCRGRETFAFLHVNNKEMKKKNSDFCLWCCNSLKSAPQQFNYFQTFFSFIENEFCFDDVLLFILLLNFWRYIKLIIQNFIWKNKIENDFLFYFRQFSIFISFDIMIMYMNLKFNFNG